MNLYILGNLSSHRLAKNGKGECALFSLVYKINILLDIKITPIILDLSLISKKNVKLSTCLEYFIYLGMQNLFAISTNWERNQYRILFNKFLINCLQI